VIPDYQSWGKYWVQYVNNQWRISTTGWSSSGYEPGVVQWEEINELQLFDKSSGGKIYYPSCWDNSTDEPRQIFICVNVDEIVPYTEETFKKIRPNACLVISDKMFLMSYGMHQALRNGHPETCKVFGEATKVLYPEYNTWRSDEWIARGTWL
jgi:hypothetical protein